MNKYIKLILLITLTILLIFIAHKIYVNNKVVYIKTYMNDVKMGLPYQDYYDENFEYLGTKRVRNKMKFSRYDGYRDVNISTFYNHKKDIICTASKCENYQNLVNDQGYTTDIHISRNAQIIVRLYNDDNNIDYSELLNLENNLSLSIKGILFKRGYDDGKDLWFQSNNDNEFGENESFLYKINPETMSIIDTVDVSKIHINAIYQKGSETYFIDRFSDTLIKYENGELFPTMIINPITTPRDNQDFYFTSLTSDENNSYYLYGYDNNFFITNMDKTIRLNSGPKTCFNDSIIDTNLNQIIILMHEYDEITKSQYAVKYTYDIDTLELVSQKKAKTIRHTGTLSTTKLHHKEGF